MGITMTAIGMILVAGSPILENTQEDVRVQNVVSGLSLLDERVSAATLGGSGRKTVRLSVSEGSMRVNSSAGEVNITVHNKSGAFETARTVIYNTTNVGKVEYEIGERLIGYQGGGVWLRDKGGNLSSFRTVPEIKYAGQTLTVSLVNITSDFTTAGGSRTFVVTGRDSDRIHPIPGLSENPIQDGTVRIVVTSEYYEAWARYFEEKTVGKKSVCVKRRDGTIAKFEGDIGTDWCDVNVPQGSAILKLEPTPPVPFQNAVLSTGGKVEVECDSLVDSYNSDIAAYSPATRLENADIVANQSVLIGRTCGGGGSGYPTWYGDVKSEEAVGVYGASEVNGSIAAIGPPGGGPGPSSTVENGNNTGCPIRPGQDKMIAPEGRTIQAGGCPTTGPDDVTKTSTPDVDSNPVTNIDMNARIANEIQSHGGAPTLPTSGSTINITPDTYFVDGTWDDAQWEGDTINWKTETAGIDVVINNDSSAQMNFKDGLWNITGENPVRFWVGCKPNQNSWRFQNSETNVVENFTGLVQVYAMSSEPSSCSTSTKVWIDNSTYYGTIYAPTNDRIELTAGSEYFGAIFAQETEIISSDIHYDEALRRLQLDAAGDQDRINYLFVSDNKVRLE